MTTYTPSSLARFLTIDAETAALLDRARPYHIQLLTFLHQAERMDGLSHPDRERLAAALVDLDIGRGAPIIREIMAPYLEARRRHLVATNIPQPPRSSLPILPLSRLLTIEPVSASYLDHSAGLFDHLLSLIYWAEVEHGLTSLDREALARAIAHRELDSIKYYHRFYTHHITEKRQEAAAARARERGRRKTAERQAARRAAAS